MNLWLLHIGKDLNPKTLRLTQSRWRINLHDLVKTSQSKFSTIRIILKQKNTFFLRFQFRILHQRIVCLKNQNHFLLSVSQWVLSLLERTRIKEYFHRKRKGILSTKKTQPRQRQQRSGEDENFCVKNNFQKWSDIMTT